VDTPYEKGGDVLFPLIYYTTSCFLMSIDKILDNMYFSGIMIMVGKKEVDACGM
jgi:hypothetical protein